MRDYLWFAAGFGSAFIVSGLVLVCFMWLPLSFHKEAPDFDEWLEQLPEGCIRSEVERARMERALFRATEHAGTQLGTPEDDDSSPVEHRNTLH